MSTENQLVPLLREAMTSRDIDPAKLSALLQVRRDWEADEARKSYARAITEFQRRVPIVAKADRGDKSDYAKIDRIWRTIRPLLTELGLSITWQIAEMRDGVVHLEGKLGHSEGHAERLVSDIPVAEVIKNKEGRAVTNAAQMVGSARSYAQRYAVCSALGVVTGDDDDGRAAGTCYVSQDQADEIEALLSECRAIPAFNEIAFWRWLGMGESGVALDIQLARAGDVVAMLKRKLGRS